MMKMEMLIESSNRDSVMKFEDGFRKDNAFRERVDRVK